MNDLMADAPTISVIMPAFNCSNYLYLAIDSILEQSFTDFEFIIINDGSTDNTEDVVLSYTDTRIKYKRNAVNRGLIHTLNRGLDEAQGHYIARMDGDDVALPQRLEKQLKHLKENTAIDVLATQVTLIDEEGKDIGVWKDDVRYSNATSIKRFLPSNNCIAHPTVMGKLETFLRYRYDPLQKLSEDYDLWLRITSAGGVIDKLPQPLLQHRILQTSFTRTRKINVFYKLARVKWVFIKRQLKCGRINKFIVSTALYAILDVVKGVGKKLKNPDEKNEE